MTFRNNNAGLERISVNILLINGKWKPPEPTNFAATFSLQLTFLCSCETCADLFWRTDSGFPIGQRKVQQMFSTVCSTPCPRASVIGLGWGNGTVLANKIYGKISQRNFGRREPSLFFLFYLEYRYDAWWCSSHLVTMRKNCKEANILKIQKDVKRCMATKYLKVSLNNCIFDWYFWHFVLLSFLWHLKRLLSSLDMPKWFIKLCMNPDKSVIFAV